MTLEEYIKEQRERVDNMTLAQARKVVADRYGHYDMRIECEKAVWMLLNCADEKINSGWIPVTERLPEEHLCKDGYIEPSDYVLVWGDNGSYGVSRYWGNRRSKAKSPNTYKDWLDLDWVVQKPIAWMPLPQPYKAESEGEE